MFDEVALHLEPRHAILGVVVALGVLLAWGGSLALLLSIEWAGSMWWAAPMAVAWQTFLCTGLFITAHDAMHRTVCWKHKGLNDLIGTVALVCYALFSFDQLITKHHEHHDHPGTEDDPDFHDGTHRSFWGWYGTFLWRYLSIWQIVGMAIIFNILLHGVGIPESRLIVFWVLPSLLSTLQLFYFGTYLPHRDHHGEEGWRDAHHARTSAWPTWLSFITCYHFGYHWEHHAYPHAPWWLLPTVRQQVAAIEESAAA